MDAAVRPGLPGAIGLPLPRGERVGVRGQVWMARRCAMARSAAVPASGLGMNSPET